jgi:hypothetical protein
MAIAAAKCEHGEKGNTKANNNRYPFISHNVPFPESILPVDLTGFYLL